MAKQIKATPTPNLNEPLTTEQLGMAVKAMRTQSQLRLEDAAALCGVAKQTLMNIEQGTGTSQLDTILQICNALGIKLYIQPWPDSSEDSDVWD